ncbi:hypothetical protein LTR66_006892, partial [Elasticomyces elasticus]
MLGLWKIVAVAATVVAAHNMEGGQDQQQHDPQMWTSQAWGRRPESWSADSWSWTAPPWRNTWTTSTVASTPSATLPAAPESTTVVEVATTQVVYSTVDVTVTACGTSTDCPTSTASVSGAPTSSMGNSRPSSTSSACTIPTGKLTNEKQVGNSTWGTLCQPTFPQWLDNGEGKPYESAPWGNCTTKTCDATIKDHIPVTGVTRYYDLTISRGRISADGVLRDVMMINGQFPGPAIEANWGDMINVTVRNNITAPVEGTSLHWHGMLQRNTPWMDGVPAVTQCPIAPGASFTYVYQAELYGTSWYHAHYSSQYTAGVVGPMIIYGPSSQSYDIDLGPVMLTDWYHIPYFSIVQDVVGTDLRKLPPTSDSVLINGRNSFNCSAKSYDSSAEWLGSDLRSDIKWTCVEDAPLSKFKFQPGKTHRLRLVNHGADGIQKFSIDGHSMTVIAVDYVPITPYTTNVVTLGVAQRTDVLVTANNYTQSSYWMRAINGGGVPCGGSSNPQALAAIYYEGADTTSMPTTATS